MSGSRDNELEQLTDGVVASYRGDDRTHRIGETSLPSRQKIVKILGEIRELLFPGYFGQKNLTMEGIRYHVGDVLARLGEDLTEQIAYCLCAGGTADSDAQGKKAAEITNVFLRRIPDIRQMLALDAQAAYDGDPAAKNIDVIIYSYPGYYAVTVYRVAHELEEFGIPLMPRIMSEHAHSQTGTDIHPGAKIGKNFFIDHATGVVIGETTEIGDNVKIYQGVTLGARSFPKDERGRAIKGHKRHPTIEDDVTIYANATILGGQTVIGQGATVNGNTFVLESISAYSTVTSDKPGLRVRSRNGPAR